MSDLNRSQKVYIRTRERGLSHADGLDLVAAAVRSSRSQWRRFVQWAEEWDSINVRKPAAIPVAYTADQLHPVAADGRRLEGQEYDGHDVLAWINLLNSGKAKVDDVPAWIARCIPADALKAGA